MSKTIARFILFLSFTSLCLSSRALDRSIALTPPMGWSSWNYFHASIDEATVRGVADALVSSGMRDAGYVYVNLDDPWADSRDSAGYLQPDLARFPNGIKALVDYVHSKGLKFGIYTSVTTLTCQGKPGSAGYEAQDAAQFAEWGVDAVKDDFCFGGSPADIQSMHDAIQLTKRPMLFEADSGPEKKSWLWARGIAHLWRTGVDIKPNWADVCRILDETATNLPAPYAGPGHWNDPDMLEVGNPGLSEPECRVHFGLWSILAAPLIAGNDVRNMSDTVRDILINPDVIAVDQDQLGLEGYRLSSDGSTEVWVRKLVDGSYAIGLLNRGDSPLTQMVSWKDLGWTQAPVRLRDLWNHSDLEVIGDRFSTVVPPHDLVLIRAYAQDTQILSIVSAIALDDTTIRVHFSATVERASVEDSANYSVGNLSIVSAQMNEDSQTVVLKTSSIGTSTKLFVMLAGARRPFADVTPMLAAPLLFSRKANTHVKLLRGKGFELTIPKMKEWYYASLEAGQNDVDLPGTVLESSTNGRVWTPVYRFDRMPFFNEFTLIDLPPSCRYLRATPLNNKLIKQLVVYGAGAPPKPTKVPPKNK